MKKSLFTLLTICLLFSFVLPAYAADMTAQEQTQEGQQPEDQQESQDSPVVVSTLGELLTAINTAGKEDTIYVSKSIWLNDVSLICDKNITIRGLEQTGNLFYLSGDCVLSGFNFIADYQGSPIALIENNGFRVCDIKINDCQFIGDGIGSIYLVNIFSGNVELQNCTFNNKTFTAMGISRDATVVIEGCLFNGTQTLAAGGAIYNSGNLTICNTKIVDNTSGIGGAIYNSGSLTIFSSIIKGNTGKNEFDVIEGNDIYSKGTLIIADEQIEGEGFYEEDTGEKLKLPLVDYTGTARLTYLTDEEAEKYFAPEPPTAPPQEPGDQTGDDDTTGGGQPLQEPTQPPKGEGKDNPADNPDNGDQDIPTTA